MNLLYLIWFVSFSIFALVVLNGNMYEINRVNIKKSVWTIRLKKSTPFILIIILWFAVLCATRSMDSYDVQPYVNYLYTINSIPFTEINGMYGLGFEILTKILVIFVHDNYVLYFGIISVINCGIVWWSLKKFEKVWIYGFILYLGFLGFYYNYIVIRQAFAISFVILTYAALLKEQKRWIVFLLIAISFHESAILALLIISLSRFFRLKSNTLYLLLIISLLFYLTKISDRLINPVLSLIHGILPVRQFYKYILYFDNVEYIHDISLLYLLYYIMSFAIIYFIKNSRNNIPRIVYTLLTCNILGLFLLGFFSSLPAISRAADYLSTCTYIFLIPMVLEQLERKSRLFIIIILFLIMIFMYVRIILGATNLFI